MGSRSRGLKAQRHNPRRFGNKVAPEPEVPFVITGLRRGPLEPLRYAEARRIMRNLGWTLTRKGGELYLEPQRSNRDKPYWPKSPQDAFDWVVAKATHTGGDRKVIPT